MSELKPILLVDDSEPDVELTVIALKEDAKISNEIDVVYDGEEALEYLLRRGRYSDRTGPDPVVILLDLKMPKVSGFEVLDVIKKDETLRRVPVVILTSSKEDQDIVKCYSQGANAFVVKPVGAENFTQAIKQIGLFWGVVNVVST